MFFWTPDTIGYHTTALHRTYLSNLIDKVTNGYLKEQP